MNINSENNTGDRNKLRDVWQQTRERGTAREEKWGRGRGAGVICLKNVRSPSTGCRLQFSDFAFNCFLTKDT